MIDAGEIIEIEMDQLDLDLSNPRHEKMSKPSDAIAYLLTKERVMDMAEDIAEIGMTNPMDLLGVFARSGAGGRKTYIAAEGNRRVCALQLLHDPERIPTSFPGRKKLIERLETLSDKIDLNRKMTVCLFKTKKDAKPWIDRMHNSESKGTRRRWRPDQQERAIGGGRNKDALAIMDLAQENGLIDQAQREQKLTTVQRYVGNPAFRNAFGLHREKDKSISVLRDPEDFKKLFVAFINDAKDGNLSSRSSADDVSKYASKKVIECGVSQKTSAPFPISSAFKELQETEAPNAEKETEIQQPPQAPTGPSLHRKTIGFDSAVVQALDSAKIDKLSSLYRSCCELQLSKNSPLITVGFWSILESLCAIHGEKPFKTYLSKDKISNLLPNTAKANRNDIWNALERISIAGNSTKHSARAANFDGFQLANDIDIINPILVELLKTIPSKLN